MKSHRLLVLGNGGAAVNAIKAARLAGHTGEICQIADTSGPAFNPMLSPYFLKGSVPWDNCFPFGAEFYQRYEVVCHFGSGVEALDAENKTVCLANGKRLSYDRCLIATGADSVIPPVPGLKGSPHAFPLRTPESALRLKQVMSASKRAVVLGASLVGVKVAEILRRQRVEVILLDVADQMLPGGTHATSAAFLEEYFIQQGIDVRLGCTLEGLEGTSEGVSCFFPESIIEEADFVAVCTGIRPNLAFVDPVQVEIDSAILVDEQMRTSADGLYAAGDVCQGMNRLSGKREWIGTWGNACYQGRTAGFNMAGQYAAYAGTIPQHVSPFFAWTYAQVGDVKRKGENVHTESHGNPFEGMYRVVTYDENIPVGVNLFNCLDGVGEMKKAITEGLEWPLEKRSLPRIVRSGLKTPF